MKLLDIEIKNKLINSLVAGPPLVMLWLLRQIYMDLAPLIPKEWFANIPPIAAIKIIILLAILNLLTVAYCIYLIFKEKEHKMPEPTLSYGIYFDYTFQPLCPSCKTPLQIESVPIEQQIMKLKKPKLICPNGHYKQVPTDDLGIELHIANLRSTLIMEHFNIKDEKQ